MASPFDFSQVLPVGGGWLVLCSLPGWVVSISASPNKSILNSGLLKGFPNLPPLTFIPPPLWACSHSLGAFSQPPRQGSWSPHFRGNKVQRRPGSRPRPASQLGIGTGPTLPHPAKGRGPGRGQPRPRSAGRFTNKHVCASQESFAHPHNPTGRVSMVLCIDRPGDKEPVSSVQFSSVSQ